MGTKSESFLKDFHRQHPGCTSNVSLLGVDADGRNSYQCVAEALLRGASARTPAVLDLACGDGTLLRIIHQEHLAADLAGVDMSADELALARQNLSGVAVRLIEGRAQELPFKDKSFDFIFCHYALMLMSDIEKVLEEIRRTLKGSGTFSAVLAGTFIRSAIFDDFSRDLAEIMKSENTNRLSFGDSRIQSIDEAQRLLENYFLDVKIKELPIYYEAGPEDLVDFFMLTYQVGRLSVSGKESLRKKVLENLKSRVVDGKVRFTFNLRQITCKNPRP